MPHEFHKVSPSGGARWAASLLVLSVTLATWRLLPRYLIGPHLPSLLTTAVFSTETLFFPLGLALAYFLAAEPLGRHLTDESLESKLAAAAILLTCISLAAFIFHFGNRQFGAWDYNITIDTGWRQILGQRPYTGFITPNPPGFNLGIFYAFRCFGVTWNAQLAWTILFSLASLLWTFVLCRALTMRPLAAWFFALLPQAVTFVPSSFWWYNGVTAVLACIFLLSVYLCAQRPGYRPWPWLSYTAALALLALEKPNIAGLLIVGGAGLLFIAAPRPRWKMLLWSTVGVLLALLILWIHHISLLAMLNSYRAAAIERGGLKAFALQGMKRATLLQVFLIPALCSIPILAAWEPLRAAVARSDWRHAAKCLLLFLPIPVTLYGLTTDADFREMESAITLMAAATAAFSWRLATPRIRALLIGTSTAIMLALLAAGIRRDRVMSIGPGVFYEAQNNELAIRDHFFSSMTAGPIMVHVQQEVQRAADQLPKPIFFGPRLEFEYADLRLPSPPGWTVYYQPGTSFARRDVPRLTQFWEDQRFPSLVFLGNDTSFYPPELLAAMHRDYELVPGYSSLRVYIRRK